MAAAATRYGLAAGVGDELVVGALVTLSSGA